MYDPSSEQQYLLMLGPFNKNPISKVMHSIIEEFSNAQKGEDEKKMLLEGIKHILKANAYLVPLIMMQQFTYGIDEVVLNFNFVPEGSSMEGNKLRIIDLAMKVGIPNDIIQSMLDQALDTTIYHVTTCEDVFLSALYRACYYNNTDIMDYLLTHYHVYYNVNIKRTDIRVILQIKSQKIEPETPLELAFLTRSTALKKLLMHTYIRITTLETKGKVDFITLKTNAIKQFAISAQYGIEIVDVLFTLTLIDVLYFSKEEKIRKNAIGTIIEKIDLVLDYLTVIIDLAMRQNDDEFPTTDSSDYHFLLILITHVHMIIQENTSGDNKKLLLNKLGDTLLPLSIYNVDSKALEGNPTLKLFNNEKERNDFCIPLLGGAVSNTKNLFKVKGGESTEAKDTKPGKEERNVPQKPSSEKESKEESSKKGSSQFDEDSMREMLRQRRLLYYTSKSEQQEKESTHGEHQNRPPR